MRGAPLTIASSSHCKSVVEQMTDAGVSSALLCNDNGQLVGIVTDQDMTRRIAFQKAPDDPVSDVMTHPVMTIEANDYLYHAIARMRRHGLKHMPVVDRKCKPLGILDLHDAMAIASDRLMTQIDRLTHEGSLEGLKEIKDAQVFLARELLDDSLPAPEVQSFLTHVNNDIYRRIIDSTIGEMDEEGWGTPPVRFAAIVFGSGGRGENYLFPDQDNGFILEDYPDEEHARIDAYFIELAERMTRDLNAVGLPYCKGYCMASNPLWRKTISQWTKQIELWSRKRNFVAIRLSDIFFDFEPVYGEIKLAKKLRKRVSKMIAANSFYLSAMFHEIADHNVALGIFGGFFGNFITETENEAFKGQVNLKHTGTLPMVEAVRLLALREAVEETSTLGRVRSLYEKGVFDDNENEGLNMAFELLTDILLNKQINDFQSGETVSYYIRTESLSKRRQKRLTEALQAIDDLRKRVRTEFTADIF